MRKRIDVKVDVQGGPPEVLVMKQADVEDLANGRICKPRILVIRVEVHDGPTAAGFTRVRHFAGDDRRAPAAFRDVELRVAELFV